jgi:CheY-like chemotaxis protein
MSSGTNGRPPRVVGGLAPPGRVLIVDDDDAVCRALKNLLVTAGFEVVVATDGAYAMAEVESRPFDVILSDIKMPGVSGIELLRKVRARSGRAGHPDDGRALARDGDGGDLARRDAVPD